METNDTEPGGESLSIEQAAAAYAKATSEAVPEDHAEEEDEAEGEPTDDELQASDEDVSESDDQPESEEDTAEDEDGESETERGRFVADDGRVRLSDGTITTVNELKRGFLRESDYTRKRQEDAALSKETAAEREALKASKQQIEEQSRYVAELVKSIVPPMPDPAMARSDPAGYMEQRATHEQWVAHLQYLDGQRQQSEQESKAKAEKDAKEKRAREWAAALEKMPELKDQTKVQALGNDILKYGADTYGFSREELATVPNDHRLMMVLRDATAWRKLQASKGSVQKKVEGRPPVQKGGKRLSPGAHRARTATDAMTRLKQEGTVEAATAAYLAHLNKG